MTFKTKTRLEDLAVSLSLSNLLFFRHWQAALDQSLDYYLDHAPTGTLAALFVNVALTALLLFAAGQMVRTSSSKWLKTAARYFLLLLVFTSLLGLVYAAINKQLPGSPASHAMWLLVAGTTLLAFAAWNVQLFRLARVACLLLFPFVLLIAVQAGIKLWSYHANPLAFSPQSLRPQGQPAQPASQLRVLWVVFDEMDREIAFDRQLDKLSLPNLSRFRAESFSGRNASPPSDQTSSAIPSLLRGELVHEVKAVNSRRLDLRLKAGDVVEFSSRGTIFEWARVHGHDSAVLGWYHPYCRVLDSASTCIAYSVPSTMAVSLGGEGFVPDVTHHFRYLLRWHTSRLFQHSELSAELPRDRSHHQVLQHLRSAALHELSQPWSGLFFLHLNVPHPPGIYNRKLGKDTPAGDSSYADNLVLADELFGQIREVLEKNVSWDNTAVVVSSDHGWRPKIWTVAPGFTEEDRRLAESVGSAKTGRRVPFMVKLPHSSQHYRYEPEFNTVLTRWIIQAIMAGEIRTADDLRQWLDTNREAENRQLQARH